MNCLEIVSTISKSAISAIPYIGGSAVSIWNDLQEKQIKRKITRFEEFMNSLQNDINAIENKINQNFITENDCQDIFEKVSKMIVNERVNEKRKLYKNVFLNSMIDKIVDFDIIERDLRFIEQLNTIEIIILKIFDDPEEYNKRMGNIIKDPFLDENGHYINSYQRKYYIMDQIMLLMPQIIKREDVLESLIFLSQNRILINGIENKQLNTNGSPIDIFYNAFTTKGERFIKRLKDINE